MRKVAVGNFRPWLRRGSLFSTDLALSMAIFSLVIVGYLAGEAVTNQTRFARLEGEAVKHYSTGFEKYLANYFNSNIRAALSAGPVVISVADLVTAGIAPAGDLGRVGSGQTVQAVVYTEPSGLVDDMIETVGGSALSDGQVITAAQEVGTAGYFVTQVQPTAAQRVSGGYSINLSTLNSEGFGVLPGHIGAVFNHQAGVLGQLNIVSTQLYNNGDLVPMPSCPAGLAPSILFGQAVAASGSSGDLMSGVTVQAVVVGSSWQVEISVRTTTGWEQPDPGFAQATGIVSCS